MADQAPVGVQGSYMNMKDEVLSNLSRHIDISCVQAPDTRDDVRQLAADAKEYDFMSAHVLPQFAAEALEMLR